MTSSRILATVLIIAAASLPATAAIIASDSFESYPNGNLSGAAGGTGWTNPWTAITGVLTNQDETGVSTRAAEIAGATNSVVAATRTFAQQTGTLYFSVRVTAVAGLEGSDFLHFYLSNNATTNGNSGGIGLLTTTDNLLGARVGTTNGGDTTNSTTSVTQGQTYLLVGKLSKTSAGNYNRADLYINPTTTTEPGAADATDTADSGIAALSVFAVRSFNFDAGDRYQFDDVTIGNTFADVVPAPEPTTMALLALAATTTLARRRRRR